MNPHLRLAAALVLALPACCPALVTAYDDASDPAYAPSAPYATLTGGFGFSPWIHSLPVGPLHAYVSTSTLNGPGGPDIDTAGLAWGNNADPTGNTFLARRSLTFDLPVGGTYSISYDGGDVDGQETLAWGLNNQSMCQFFFNNTSPDYQFTDTLSGNTITTSIGQTFGGLRLTLTRDSASTYSFQAVRLSDLLGFSTGPLPYNTSLIPGIRTINISNNDGGAGGGHAMYVNAIEATAVPEPSSLLAVAVIAATVLARKTASQPGCRPCA
jgi:hypothetical protein